MTKEYGKPGAVVLFGFSFVWPHVKLALLHLFFYLPMTSRGRRNGNYWLAVFGKWSFTDVLVMSALVGVFHLTLDTTASEVWDSAGPDLIETCGGTCGTFMHEKTHPFEGIGQAIEAKLPPLQKFNDWNREQQDKMEAALQEALKSATAIAAEARRSAEAAAESARLQSASSLDTVQLKTVVSQGTDEVVPKLGKQELTAHCTAFREVYGRDPNPEEECAGDQLTAIHSLLRRDLVPLC